MTATNIFYRERAAEARKGAASATLQNVRDRWLTSEATWSQLAIRGERAEAAREKLIIEKAAERAATSAAAQS